MRTFLTVPLAMLLLTASLAKGEEDHLEVLAEEDELEEVPVVNTTLGLVSGIREKSTRGKVFYSYYSIPYAQPPTGELRFKNPEAADSWEGVRDGSQMPPMCPQNTIESIINGGNDDVEGEENCLYLNVFTPRPKMELPLKPVMVFIHGGGYMSGGAEQYPPNVLLNEDIILVVIQYRLGVLGFLSTEDEAAPGNLGLKDQTLALSWVQNNILRFGGDPVEVTIFGESAGASSVHFQILSHRSLGLFKRAILQSGTALCPWAFGGAHAVVAQSIGTFFNCSSEGGSQQLISCLQGVDAKKLVPTLFRFMIWGNSPMLIGPRVDNDFLYGEPEFLMKESRHKSINLISGVTENEGALIALPMYVDEAVRSSLMYNFVMNGPVSLEFSAGDISPLNQTVKIYDHYLKGLNLGEEHADNVTQMFGDRHFNMCHDLTTSFHSKNVRWNGRKTYRYELNHRGQHSLSDFYPTNVGKKWINHADDLFYLFTGGPIWKPLEREEDQKLSQIITKLWTNFAATGNPTPDDSLGFIWNPVEENDFSYLSLNPSPSMKEDKRKETREFWNSLPLKQNLILHPELVANITYHTPQQKTGEGSQKTEGAQQKTEGAPEKTGIKNKEEL